MNYEDGPLMTVRLVTRDNHFVADVKIPPFQKMPDALMWGMRTFYRDPTTPDLPKGQPMVFSEIFVVAVVTS